MLFLPIKNLKSAGYTLVEVATTAILIGIVVTAALPNFSGTAEKSRSSEGVQIISAIWQAQQLYILENNGTLPAAIGDLDIEIPTSTPHFTTIELNPVAGQTARADQGDGDYSLYISDAGDITCDDDPAGLIGICQRMGYAAYD